MNRAIDTKLSLFESLTMRFSQHLRYLPLVFATHFDRVAIAFSKFREH
jgi:hypothetical protein